MKLIDEIRAMSQEERRELVDVLRGLDADPVPVTVQAGPNPVDEYGRKLSLAEQYDREHPLQMRKAGFQETALDAMTGKRTVKKWSAEDIEEYNQRQIAEHKKAKAAWLAERGVES